MDPRPDVGVQDWLRIDYYRFMTIWSLFMTNRCSVHHNVITAVSQLSDNL